MANKFSLEERILLTTGKGMWHTQEIKGKLPSIHLSDGPHGLRKQEDGQTNNDSVPATCFPTASCLANSFDKELVKEVASAIAREAHNENVSILLGPGINMKRSPTCGRNFEYFSEDPYLSGILGTSYVNAVQELGIATCLKHFACNSQETKRMSANSIVDDKALHSIYLKAFEMVVKNAYPASIMASYNRINNEYATENKYLLTDVLRNNWHYKGAVISDWGASINLTKSIKAGTSLEMPGTGKSHIRLLKKDLKNNLINEEDINRASNEVINLVNKYSIENRRKKDKYNISNHHYIAVKASEESAVLLKNENNILPIKSNKILIVGGLAETIRYQGGGSSHINTLNVKNPIEAWANKGFKVDFEKGYMVESSTSCESLISKAVEKARNSEIVVFYGGLTDIFEGEGYDRKSFSMPENQIELLNKIYEVNKNIVFVSFQGSPYDMEPLEKCKAILSMYLGGEGVSEAVVNLLSGLTNPSGKLAETIPYKLEDTPAYGNFATGSNNVPYKESIFIGYRYYDTFQVPVRYEFGYGLSYTKFKYSNLKIVSNINNEFEVKFDITNIGNNYGREIAQIYIKPTREDYLRPNRELKGFAKIAVRPNETKTVLIKLEADSFKEYDRKLCWITLDDDVEIQVSSSLNNVQLKQIVHINGVKQIEDERNLYPSYFDKKKMLKNIKDEDFTELFGKEIKNFDDTKPGEFTMANSLMECTKYSFKAKMLLELAMKVTYGSFKNKPKDDPEVMMQIETIKDGTLDCVLTQGGIPYRIGESILLSCNKHRFKALWKLIRG